MLLYTHLALVASILCISDATMSRKFREKRAITANGTTGVDELDITPARNYAKSYAFNQVRQAVDKKLVNENMKKDIYLVKFLTASGNMYLPAIDMINRALVFRAEQGFDNSTRPDYSAQYKKFEVSTTELDIQGRIILYYEVGKWGLKSALAANESALYERASYQVFEDVANTVVERYEAGLSKYAQYVFIVDYEEWTSEEGACSKCVDIVGRIIFKYCQTWPGFAHSIIVINTSPDFKLFYELVRSFISPRVKEKLEVFGRKREVWCPEVKKLTDHPKLRKYCNP